MFTNFRHRRPDKSQAGAAEAERKKRLETEGGKAIAPTPAGNVLPPPPPPTGKDDYPPKPVTGKPKKVKSVGFAKLSSEDAANALEGVSSAAPPRGRRPAGTGKE